MCPQLRQMKSQQMPAQNWQQSHFPGQGQNPNYGGLHSEVERLIVGNAGSREVKLELVVQEKDLKHVRERLAQPLDASPSIVDTMNAHLAGLGLVQPKPKVAASPSKGELLTAITNSSVQINARLDSSDTARKALSLRIDGIMDRVVHLEDTGKRDRADGYKGPRKAARGGGAPKKRVVLDDSDSEEEPPVDEYWGKYTESAFLKDAEKFVGDDYENKDWVKTLIRALGLGNLATTAGRKKSTVKKIAQAMWSNRMKAVEEPDE